MIQLYQWLRIMKNIFFKLCSLGKRNVWLSMKGSSAMREDSLDEETEKWCRERELQEVILTWCSMGSQRTFDRDKRKDIGQSTRKETPQQAIRESLCDWEQHGVESMGSREKQTGQEAGGNGLEVGQARSPEEELGKSWSQLGLFLSLLIFLPSADKIQRQSVPSFYRAALWKVLDCITACWLWCQYSVKRNSVFSVYLNKKKEGRANFIESLSLPWHSFR